MSGLPPENAGKNKSPDREQDRVKAKQRKNNSLKKLKAGLASECDRAKNLHSKDIVAFCNSEKTFVCSDCLVSECRKLHEIITVEKAVELAVKSFERNKNVIAPYEDQLSNITLLLVVASNELRKIGADTLREVNDFFEKIRNLLVDYQARTLEFWNAFIEKESSQLLNESDYLRACLEEVHKLTIEIPELGKSGDPDLVGKVIRRTHLIEELTKFLQSRLQISVPPVFSRQRAFQSLLKNLKTDVNLDVGINGSRNEFDRAMRRDYKQLKEEGSDREGKCKETKDGIRVRNDVNFWVEAFEGSAKSSHIYEILGKAYESINSYTASLLKSEKKGMHATNADRDGAAETPVSGLKRWKNEKELLDFLRKKYPDELKRQYFKDEGLKAKTSTDTIPTQFAKKINPRTPSKSPSGRPISSREGLTNKNPNASSRKLLKGENERALSREKSLKENHSEKGNSRKVHQHGTLTPTKDEKSANSAAINFEKTVKKYQQEVKHLATPLENSGKPNITSSPFNSATNLGSTMTGLSSLKEAEILLKAANKSLEKASQQPVSEGLPFQEAAKEHSFAAGIEMPNKEPQEDSQNFKQTAHRERRNSRLEGEQAGKAKLGKRNSFSNYMRNNNFVNLVPEVSKNFGDQTFTSSEYDALKGNINVQNGGFPMYVNSEFGGVFGQATQNADTTGDSQAYSRSIRVKTTKITTRETSAFNEKAETDDDDVN